MKLLLLLCLSFFTSMAIACTDFTGSYAEESGDTFSVIQTKCAKVTVNNKDGTFSYITDKRARVTEETSEIRVTTTAAFIGNNLTVESKIKYLIKLPDFPVEYIPVRVLMVDTKDAEGNIVETSFIYNALGGVIYDSTSTAKKL